MADALSAAVERSDPDIVWTQQRAADLAERADAVRTELGRGSNRLGCHLRARILSASPAKARRRRARERLHRPLAARLSNRYVFQRQFARLFSAGHPLRRDEAEDQWALWRRAGGHRIAHRLIFYIGERTRFAERWHGAIRDWPGPLHLAWGMRDPVATPRVLAGLRGLRPAARVSELADLGHYPQIERPEAIALIIRDLLSAL